MVEVWYSGRRECMEFSEVFTMMAPRDISDLLWPACCFLLVFLLAACSAGSSHSSLFMTHRPTQVATTQAPGTPAASPADSNRCINAALGPDAQGMDINTTVGATIESTTGLPILAKHDVKIIWDMVGVGPFHVFGLGPRGIRVLPLQGPQAYLSSDGTCTRRAITRSGICGWMCYRLLLCSRRPLRLFRPVPAAPVLLPGCQSSICDGRRRLPIQR
jgi:hypothetical protein